ncbi:tetratricopeptide repeat protein [Chlorobium sp. N1]|uniref:tetratricopeptide repeat protein n=1 Tax=Chlorobium sp. N1 TaxID=2491138 RepID=UPI00103DEC73|nr:tetratricopeptide repeat protein [Chlorobium sp. N1]TCD47509.1 hypothetical protein E0L29_08200 [Chlorobium sp. N1]
MSKKTDWPSRAYQLEQRREFAELEIHCRQWVIAESESATAWYHLGNVLLKTQKVHDALEPFRKCVSLDSGIAEGWNNLGVALMISGEGAPVEMFEKAIALKPGYAEALNNLGVALKDVDPARSLWLLRKAIRLKADYADAWSNLADILWRGGNADAAVDGYLHAIALRKEYPQAWSRLTHACRQMVEPARRREVLDELRRIDPARSESFAREVLA